MFQGKPEIPIILQTPSSSGSLCPLANPETLKNLPMCNFEKSAYGNGHFFKIVLKIPQIPTQIPHGAGAVGSGGGYLGYVAKLF